MKFNIMKLDVKDYIIIVLVFLFILNGFLFTSGVSTLKKENKALQATIKANNKQIDQLSIDISNLKNDISQELIIIEKQKKELTDLKAKNKLIEKKYEKLFKNYNNLSSDDKWEYFRTIINN